MEKGGGVRGQIERKGAIRFVISPNEEVYYVILKRKGKKTEAVGDVQKTEK